MPTCIGHSAPGTHVDVLHRKYCIPGADTKHFVGWNTKMCDNFLSQRLKAGHLSHRDWSGSVPLTKTGFNSRANTVASDSARQSNAADPIKNIGTHTNATCNARRHTPVSSHEFRCTRHMHPPVGHVGNGGADSICLKDVHRRPQTNSSVVLVTKFQCVSKPDNTL